MIQGSHYKKLSIYDKMFDKNVLCEFYRGSIAHGMFIKTDTEFPSDDEDMMVIYSYPRQYYYTLESYHQSKNVFEEKHEDVDVVGYEVKKAFYLLGQLNPNIIPALYTRKEDFTILTPAWQMVIDNRDLFTNKTRIRDVYYGYAKSQYRRMIDKHKYFGYMGAKRRKLYEKLGYDAKYASHSIRLMRVGTEWLRDGEPQIFRQDSEELLEIKEGKWSLDKIKKKYGVELLNLETAYRNSKLQDKQTKHKVNKLLYEVMDLVLKEN